MLSSAPEVFEDLDPLVLSGVAPDAEEFALGCEFNFQDERYEHYFYLCICIFYKRISVKMNEIL